MAKDTARRGLLARISGGFERFSAKAARLAGRPATFLAALALVLGWASLGPLVGFSDTWQLVINTTTTIITFLMVFLIQHSQNRDALAVQIKLAELLVAAKGADADLATAEELSESTLEELHERFKATTGNSARRRAGRKRAAAE